MAIDDPTERSEPYAKQQDTGTAERQNAFAVPNYAGLQSFLDAFDEEKRQHVGEISPGVYRGKGPVLSAYLEDLFAVYLKKALDSSSIYLLIDVSVRIGSISCRPDIAVIEIEHDNVTVLGFVDCKTSLGWSRDNVYGMADKYRNLRDAVVENGCSVCVGGVDGKHNGTTRFNGEHPVKPNFVWDVFVKDVWGKGSAQTVLEQIESWNDGKNALHTKIWWGQYWSEKKEGVYRVSSEDTFARLASRMRNGN